MQSIAIYCGSSKGNDSSFASSAYEVGQHLAKGKIRIIYGGAQVGVMGAVASGALDAGGEVIGILPHFLRRKEIAHEGVTQIIATETMHERKKLMEEMADGFIVLSGGFGTLDEMFEILTWGQLGLHSKPVGLLNVNGYYDHLIAMLDHMVISGILSSANRQMLIVDQDIASLLVAMKKYKPLSSEKWVGLDIEEV
jgi:uncharacterized protein (TIGR00730 family)